jgi:cell division protein FtsL
MNKRKKPAWGLVLITGVFVLYLGVVLVKQQSMMYDQQLYMDDIQAKIKQEEALKQELLKQEEKVNSDEFVEKIAREELGMVKPGERIFVDINN